MGQGQRLIIIDMQSLSDDERKLVLGEVLADELRAIHEYVKDIPGIKRDITTLKTDVHELKSDMKVVKVAVSDLSRQLHQVDRRVARLEAAV